MVTFISDQPNTIVTEQKTCPDCGAAMTKTHDNDPLNSDKSNFKCNNPVCGNTHTVYN
jgi:ribosomal protein S27AE